MNLWLRENIPLLFIQALRADEDIKKRLHLFLPNPIEISQNFWKVVADKIWLLLNEEGHFFFFFFFKKFFFFFFFFFRTIFSY